MLSAGVQLGFRVWSYLMKRETILEVQGWASMRNADAHICCSVVVAAGAEAAGLGVCLQSHHVFVGLLVNYFKVSSYFPLLQFSGF